MVHGDMILPLILIVTLGWVAARSRRAGSEMWFLCAIGGLVTMIVALDSGYYWEVFDRYDRYGDGSKFIGLTPNQLISAASLALGFFVPWHKSWPFFSFDGLDKSPQCEVRLFPQSNYATIYIRNIADQRIGLRRVAVVGADGYVWNLIGSPQTDKIVENVAYFFGIRVRSMTTKSVELEAASWIGVKAIWVHGEFIDARSWSVNAKLIWPKG